MYSRILVATDGSELADKGVDAGLALARALAARVVLRLSEAGVPLPEGAALQCDLACAFRDVLIDEEVVPIETRLDRLYVAASTVLQQHVGAQQERRWKVPLRACMHLPTC